MGMNDDSTTSLSASASNSNPRKARRRRSGRRSFKALGGMMLGNGSNSGKIQMQQQELEESSSNHSTGMRDRSCGGSNRSSSSSISDRLSYSMPGFRSRYSDADIQPLDEDENNNNNNNNISTDEGSPSGSPHQKKTRFPSNKSRVSRGVVPSLRRVMSLQPSDDKVIKKKREEKEATTRTVKRESCPTNTGSNLLKMQQREAALTKSPIPTRGTRTVPNRTKSGSILKRAAQATRPSRRASPPKRPTRTTDVPDLEPCDEPQQQQEEITKDSLSSLHSGSGGGGGGSNHNSSMKSVTISPDVSISPPRRRRERSRSPFRRTRSTPDAPSVLRNAKGEIINFEDYEDLSESSATGGSLSPRRSQSPIRRSVSGGAIVAASMSARKAKGTISKADLAPRIPMNRARSSAAAHHHPSVRGHGSTCSGSDLAPRMPHLHRGRSLGNANARSALVLKRMGTSPSPSASSNDGGGRGGSGSAGRRCRERSPMPQRRAPPKRPSGLLAKSASFRRDSKTSILPRSGSSTAAINQSVVLVGRGVRATKSACSDLAAMQMALGRTAAKTTVRGVAGGGAVIMEGLRATKSACADLAEMQMALGGVGRARSEAEPDPTFLEMMQWNPLDDEDRAKYDDVSVKRLIRRNPDALKAKYQIQVGRSMVSRSPLSTIVALGASMETVRAAIKANPDALKASNTLRSTPLHAACSFHTDMMVVRYLYHKYPDAIKATTQHVFLPLHNACQMMTPTMEMIQFLVESYPQGLTEINKLGDTPLRTAERNNSTPPNVLEYLEEETERIFSQNAANEMKRKEIMMRQSWGSKELAMDALQLQLDDTDHTTISTALMDQSEHSTSEEFSSEFAQNSMADVSQDHQHTSLLDT